MLVFRGYGHRGAGGFRLLGVLLWGLASACVGLHAQELNCSVQISSQRLQGTNRQLFQAMQRSMNEFVNNTKWTSHTFSPEERIECTMLFTLTEQVGSNEFKGTLSVQLRRPIYGTSYQSPLLNFVDEQVQFQYMEGQPLHFSEGNYTDNLTSLLAYYSYIILGFDYDSFSNLGGSDFFARAERIVQNAQQSEMPGWKAYEGHRKNRYWLAENYTSDKYRPVREASYRYHRLGLDVMSDKQTTGRASTLQALLAVQRVYRQRPDVEMLPIRVFLESKRDELCQVFSESPSAERAKAMNALVEIDPGNSSKYQAILQKQSQQ